MKIPKRLETLLRAYISLETVYLGSNSIRDLGAKVISEEIKTYNSLKTISFFSIGDEGKAIAETLKTKAFMKTVCLYSNLISDETRIILKQTFGQNIEV